MDEPRWVDRLMVDAMHFDQMQQHGGRFGIRDENALESALARARQRWSYGSSSDLAGLAAAYGYGLATNHPYVDGNKRLAFVAMAVFLGINGMRLAAPQPAVVQVMREVAAGTCGEDALAAWLRGHIVPREG